MPGEIAPGGRAAALGPGHAAPPPPGQVKVAAHIRRLLEASEILESHRDCGKVQDPYCLRCIPQVHGPVAMRWPMSFR